MTTVELELAELKTRVERLEAALRKLQGDGNSPTRAGVDSQRGSVVARVGESGHAGQPPTPGEPMDQEQLLAWLKAEGLVVDPPPMARVHAERWRALPEEEKQAIRWELDHLPPGPMASDIIIENRR